MKKLSILFMSLVSLVTIFTSCSNDDDPTPAPTILELTIKDELGVAVSDATVNLYSSLADLQNNTNVKATMTSNASGKVTFSQNLQAIVYFFNVVKGCQSNQFSVDYQTAAPITANTTTEMDVMLVDNGTVTITNASTTDTYMLYVTVGADSPEQQLGTVAPEDGGNLTLPAAIDVVLRAVKVTDLTTNPPTLSTNPADQIIKTFKLENCGDTDTFTFPAQ